MPILYDSGIEIFLKSAPCRITLFYVSRSSEFDSRNLIKEKEHISKIICKKQRNHKRKVQKRAIHYEQHQKIMTNSDARKTMNGDTLHNVRTAPYQRDSFGRQLAEKIKRTKICKHIEFQRRHSTP